MGDRSPQVLALSTVLNIVTFLRIGDRQSELNSLQNLRRDISLQRDQVNRTDQRVAETEYRDGTTKTVNAIGVH